jgi:lipopolysaccharide/colanic/teichoic acid biosynthesis glycosyltransferase
VKRLFDFFLAAIGIIFFSPIALISALMIKIEDGGPPLYVQERWGKGGKKFKAYKFRTMTPDADKKFGLRPAQENDVRVTQVGRFLRATAMDELPQLINILKGDMSFVGPRALAVRELDPSMPGFLQRHQIRPGLTGPAQIHAPRSVSLKEKFDYDFSYIETRTFLGDLGLLSASLWITARGKWESRQKKI